jgi:hypothetical protein
MVNELKLKRKLPSLLIDGATGGSDPLYQHKREQLSQLQRRQPLAYNGFVTNFKIMLDQLDQAAEQAGFQHIGFDTKGNIIRKERKR